MGTKVAITMFMFAWSIPMLLLAQGCRESQSADQRTASQAAQEALRQREERLYRRADELRQSYEYQAQTLRDDWRSQRLDDALRENERIGSEIRLLFAEQRRLDDDMLLLAMQISSASPTELERIEKRVREIRQRKHQIEREIADLNNARHDLYGSQQRMPPLAAIPHWRVLRVIDGATFEAEAPKYSLGEPAVSQRIGVVTFRLQEVETSQRDDHGFAEAHAVLEKLLQRGYGTVWIEFDSAQRPTVDQEGRVLAYAWSLAPGYDLARLINAEVIKAGPAKHSVEFGTGRYAELLRHAQESKR